MEKSQLKQIIREMLLQEAEVAPQQNDKIQGQIKIELFIDYQPGINAYKYLFTC